ncbi:MAG TPA: dihydrofolate reductase family protein [Planctomycetaceae bacterium]|nr:dihydrofolate reductase family protein [Planctomycetaceae bacterium]
MKTQYYAASSLDGFIADANDSLDWLFQFGDGPGEDYTEFIREVGAIAMGARTYEWILRHLEVSDGDQPQPWPYTQPVWVFTSRELPKIDGAVIHFVRGDVGPVHRQMAEAAEGKNVWLAGGGELVGQFHDRGLLDELFIQVAPVTLASGAPLLPRKIAFPPLQLLSAVTNEAGFVLLHYSVSQTHSFQGYDQSAAPE